MTPALRIGLTGGIASGKSTVADQFAGLGIPVIDTDRIAREVVEPGTAALGQIVDSFGPDIIGVDGALDRSRLRRLIFRDTALRQKLEAILHPRIQEKTLQIAASAGGTYQILVVPLLIETGFRELVDRVLVVDCPESAQRERLMLRDGESQNQATRIMATQIDRKTRLAAADDVIRNDGEPDATLAQVLALHNRYLALAGHRSAEYAEDDN